MGELCNHLDRMSSNLLSMTSAVATTTRCRRRSWKRRRRLFGNRTDQEAWSTVEVYRLHMEQCSLVIGSAAKFALLPSTSRRVADSQCDSALRRSFSAERIRLTFFFVRVSAKRTSAHHSGSEMSARISAPANSSTMESTALDEQTTSNERQPTTNNSNWIKSFNFTCGTMCWLFRFIRNAGTAWNASSALCCNDNERCILSTQLSWMHRCFSRPLSPSRSLFAPLPR